jgi:hypothetical protein
LTASSLLCKQGVSGTIYTEFYTPWGRRLQMAAIIIGGASVPSKHLSCRSPHSSAASLSVADSDEEIGQSADDTLPLAVDMGTADDASEADRVAAPAPSDAAGIAASAVTVAGRPPNASALHDSVNSLLQQEPASGQQVLAEQQQPQPPLLHQQGSSSPEAAQHRRAQKLARLKCAPPVL